MLKKKNVKRNKGKQTRQFNDDVDYNCTKYEIKKNKTENTYYIFAHIKQTQQNNADLLIFFFGSLSAFDSSASLEEQQTYGRTDTQTDRRIYKQT